MQVLVAREPDDPHPTPAERLAQTKLSGHDGIITVHDVVTDDRGLPWIVMELLNGRSLHTVVLWPRATPQPPAAAAETAETTAPEEQPTIDLAEPTDKGDQVELT